MIYHTYRWSLCLRIEYKCLIKSQIFILFQGMMGSQFKKIHLGQASTSDVKLFIRDLLIVFFVLYFSVSNYILHYCYSMLKASVVIVYAIPIIWISMWSEMQGAHWLSIVNKARSGRLDHKRSSASTCIILIFCTSSIGISGAFEYTDTLTKTHKIPSFINKAKLRNFSEFSGFYLKKT